jgi:hypothetical protein
MRIDQVSVPRAGGAGSAERRTYFLVPDVEVTERPGA